MANNNPLATTHINPTMPQQFPAYWASEWGEDHGLWMALNYHGVRQVFRWIDPGQFMMA